MDKVLGILDGYKTYIVGLVMVLNALLTLIGVTTPEQGGNAFQDLMEGFAILTLRRGIKTGMGA